MKQKIINAFHSEKVLGAFIVCMYVLGCMVEAKFQEDLMKQTKICPYCNKTFVTELNSKKYCRKLCAALAQARLRAKPKKRLCQLCGQVFKTNARKKFCNKSCQGEYMSRLGIYRKKEIKIPVRFTITDIDTQCKKTGISYGKFVSLKKL